MFTDKEIVELQSDKKYKKTNGFFKNFHLSRMVIKTGNSGVSASISSAGTVSLSVTVFSFLWLFFRYKVITKEITDCRSRIIEGLLNTDFVHDRNNLVREAIKPGNMWLEYSLEKVDIIGKACIDYIVTTKHRVILSKYSYMKTDEKQLRQAFQDAHTSLEQIFKLVKEELLHAKFSEMMWRYSDVLADTVCREKILQTFSTNQRIGNLTSAINLNNGQKRDSN